MSKRKKIAAIITTYGPKSHAAVIVGKFIKGFPTDDGLIAPQVEIASMYLDQIPPDDIGVAVSRKRGIPIFRSIPQALCLGGKELAVDGVLCIGEHGDYPVNEKGQQLYPRRYFFEQVCGVIAASGRAIPVFNDKHLAYSWRDARWMYDRAAEVGIPLMAGSSAPQFWRAPWLEHDLETVIEEAVVLGIKGMDGFGFHALEVLQTMVERRRGGETGVAAVQALEGDTVWEAAAAGRWSMELAQAALAGLETRSPATMQQGCEHPVVLMVEYNDGLRATLLILRDYIDTYAYAARVDGQVLATAMTTGGPPAPSFSYQCLALQEMFLTGRPQYPVERTLLTSGMTDAAMDSLYRGNVRVETPHLAIRYRASELEQFRPTAPAPQGASTVPFASEL